MLLNPGAAVMAELLFKFLKTVPYPPFTILMIHNLDNIRTLVCFCI